MYVIFLAFMKQERLILLILPAVSMDSSKVMRWFKVYRKVTCCIKTEAASIKTDLMAIGCCVTFKAQLNC